MTDQTFKGPVNQVAGRDIHNHGSESNKPKTWADLPTPQLHVIRERLEGAWAQEWRSRWLSVPGAIVGAGMLSMIGVLLLSALKFNVPFWAMATPACASAAGLAWLQRHQRRVVARCRVYETDHKRVCELIRYRVD